MLGSLYLSLSLLNTPMCRLALHNVPPDALSRPLVDSTLSLADVLPLFASFSVILDHLVVVIELRRQTSSP